MSGGAVSLTKQVTTKNQAGWKQNTATNKNKNRTTIQSPQSAPCVCSKLIRGLGLAGLKTIGQSAPDMFPNSKRKIPVTCSAMGYSRYIGSVSYWWISEVEITRNLCSILVIFVNHTLEWASSKTIVTTQSFMDTAIIRWRDVECSIISPSHSRACPVHAPDAPHVRLDVLPDCSLYPSWQTYVTLSSKLYWTEALSGTKLFMPNGGGGHFIPAIARVYKKLGIATEKQERLWTRRDTDNLYWNWTFFACQHRRMCCLSWFIFHMHCVPPQQNGLCDCARYVE